MLDRVERWDTGGIVCGTARHLDPANPLRHAGRLPAVAGIEFCLQAAAVHGGMLAGAAQRPGYVASLRAVALHVDRLDDPALAWLIVEATREAQEVAGMSYALTLRSGTRVLLSGRALIKLPA
ncbi:MAG: phosphotransferase [Acetobacteraceae bacterium]|nr:phosphotransferase [Acetobacteraceae bacterium]